MKKLSEILSKVEKELQTGSGMNYLVFATKDLPEKNRAEASLLISGDWDGMVDALKGGANASEVVQSIILQTAFQICKEDSDMAIKFFAGLKTSTKRKLVEMEIVRQSKS